MFAKLTFDEEFIDQRQQTKAKPPKMGWKLGGFAKVIVVTQSYITNKELHQSYITNKELHQSYITNKELHLTDYYVDSSKKTT